MKRSLAVAAACALALAGCGHHTPKQSATGSVHPNGWGSTPSGLQAPAPVTGVPTVTMYDATDIGQVPSSPFALGGYTAGFWKTYLPMRQRWPQAHTISIAISAGFHADCLDVEPRDAVPAQAGPWALADIAAGFKRPCLYSDLSEMPAVKASLTSVGLTRSQYFLWLAWYRFIPGLVAGYDAVQYTDRCLGLSLDCSTVTLPFLSIAQPPYVPPKPKPLPVCFTHRLSSSACSQARARVASLNGASAASWRAWHRNDCLALMLRHPVRYSRSPVCPMLSQRGHYFTSRANALEAAS